MAQSEEAREIFTNKEIKVVSLKEALVDLKDFISRDDNVWANGVLFDIGILEHAFRSEKILFPWTYGKIRCLRGIRAIFPEYEDIMNEIRVKVSHNALDDTKCQANALIALAKLKGFTL
jgi:DNA polymerase III epsilon subunit-like protein